MEPDAHLNSPSIVTTQSRERNTDSVTNATNVSAEAPPSQSLANSTTITNTQVSVPVSQGTDGRNLKRKRAGQKGAITRRINILRNMVTNRGSRTQIKSIKAEIHQTLETATKCHEDYMQLLDEDDPNFSDDWIEDLKLNVSLAAIEVQEYLDSRADEPPSEISSLHCSNWLSTGSISGSIGLDRESFSVSSDHPDERSTTADPEIEKLSSMFTETLQPWSNQQDYQQVIEPKFEPEGFRMQGLTVDLPSENPPMSAKADHTHSSPLGAFKGTLKQERPSYILYPPGRDNTGKASEVVASSNTRA